MTFICPYELVVKERKAQIRMATTRGRGESAPDSERGKDKKKGHAGKRKHTKK